MDFKDGKTKQRISWIDVTKGIAIYLVILGHSLIGLKVNDYILRFICHYFHCFRTVIPRKSIKKPLQAILKAACPILHYEYMCNSWKGSQCVLTGLDGSEYPEFVLKYDDWCSFGYGVDGSKWFFTVWMIGAIWFYGHFLE